MSTPKQQQRQDKHENGIGPASERHALQLPPCQDADSTEYRLHRWVQWGDDERYKRCSRCGTISAEGISSEAKYPRERQPERPIRHHHQFEPSRLDARYEVCLCGATTRAQKHPAPTLMSATEPVIQQQSSVTRVMHCRKDVFDLYIGRPMARFPELRALGFGNPFTTRNLPKGYSSPIDAFRDWLFGKLGLAELYREQRAVMFTQLPLLRQKALGCWCAPKGGLSGNLYGKVCHGQVLAWLADHPDGLNGLNGLLATNGVLRTGGAA